MKKPHVIIYTDGAAKGNPDGPGGYGAILQFTDSAGQIHEKELSGGYARTTNNRMELMAAIAAIEDLNRPCEVDLWSDSSYLSNPFNKHWIEGWQRADWRRGKPNEVKNIDLWERLLAAMRPHDVRFHWIKGHAGHPENERCDRLASEAAQQDGLPEDPGV